MQILDKRQALKIPPVLRLGFRPFFLLGSLLAAAAVLPWVWAWLSGATLQPLGGWLAWHRHEMLFGFAAAIIAGFLLTAVQNWTGQPGLSGRPLALLVLLWLLGRLAWWLPAPWLLLPGNLLFLLGVAAVMARSLWKVRQTRNYPMVLVLLLMVAAEALTLAGVLAGHENWQHQGVLAALWLVVAMMTLIGGRVIPFFTQRGLGRVQQVPAWPVLDGALLVGAILLGLLHVAGLGLVAQPALALPLVLLALGHGVRLLRWYDPGYWKVALLWPLHLAYVWLVLGCLGLALWHLGLLAQPGPALHALTVGAMGGLILAMIARVSLGHTGRALVLPRGFVWAFVLLNLAALLRVFGVDLAYAPALWLAALAWTAAFALYLLAYAPMLLKTRADGHPG